MASPSTPPGLVESAEIDFSPSKRRRLRYRALVEARERARIHNRSGACTSDVLQSKAACSATNEDYEDQSSRESELTPEVTPRGNIADTLLEATLKVERGVQTDAADAGTVAFEPSSDSSKIMKGVDSASVPIPDSDDKDLMDVDGSDLENLTERKMSTVVDVIDELLNEIALGDALMRCDDLHNFFMARSLIWDDGNTVLGEDAKTTGEKKGNTFAAHDSYVYKFHNADSITLSDVSAETLIRINTKLAARRSRVKQDDVTELHNLDMMIEFPLADMSDQEQTQILCLPEGERDERIKSIKQIHVDFRNSFLQWLEHGESSFWDEAGQDESARNRGWGWND